jgi:hypothetical protein
MRDVEELIVINNGQQDELQPSHTPQQIARQLSGFREKDEGVECKAECFQCDFVTVRDQCSGSRWQVFAQSSFNAQSEVFPNFAHITIEAPGAVWVR